MKARVSLDSNVLVYSEIEPKIQKGMRSAALIAATADRGVIAVQVLLEFMAVIRRNKPDQIEGAIASVEFWSRVFEIAPTTESVARTALGLSGRHGFQIWDAVIWSAASQSAATVLFTEDLHDGLSLGGMTARNPFALSEAAFADLVAD